MIDAGDYNKKISIYQIEEVEDDDGFVSDLHLWQNDKHNGLNLSHVKTDLNTIEFRVSNGTISFPVWMQNIKFLGRLMMISKKLSDILSKEDCRFR